MEQGRELLYQNSSIATRSIYLCHLTFTFDFTRVCLSSVSVFVPNKVCIYHLIMFHIDYNIMYIAMYFGSLSFSLTIVYIATLTVS